MFELILAAFFTLERSSVPCAIFHLLPPGLVARIMLRRSGFRGFQIGFKRCKRLNLVDLVNSFLASIYYEKYSFVKIGFDTAENGLLKN